MGAALLVLIEGGLTELEVTCVTAAVSRERDLPDHTHVALASGTTVTQLEENVQKINRG